jgi:hypothetical protein
MSITVFSLNREKDALGISGCGIIADGVIFPCGKVALCWRKDPITVVIHDNVDSVYSIHCRNDNDLNKTTIEYQ